LPQSGRLLYAINDAHNHGVTAIAGTNDCQKIVSGGMEGEVRIWRIGRQTQIMEGSLKEHRGRVSDIKVNKQDTQAVSSSFDMYLVLMPVFLKTSAEDHPTKDSISSLDSIFDPR